MLYGWHVLVNGEWVLRGEGDEGTTEGVMGCFVVSVCVQGSMCWLMGDGHFRGEGEEGVNKGDE